MPARGALLELGTQETELWTKFPKKKPKVKQKKKEVSILKFGLH
jgi:hypothetical protein